MLAAGTEERVSRRSSQYRDSMRMSGRASFVQLINSLPEAFAHAPPAGIADAASREPLPYDASGTQL